MKESIGGVDPDYVIKQCKEIVNAKPDSNRQTTKKFVGGVNRDYLLKRAEEFLNAPADPNFGYKGRKTRTVIKYVETPGKFFGLKLGRLRIGMWLENEIDQ